MREYTEPTPIDLQAFSTGRILKESWEISTKYFGALVMPMFILMIPGVIAAMIIDGKLGESIGNFVGGILMPIASMGINRSLITLKREGKAPTLGTTFDHGCEYWWRGIRIGIVSAFYFILLILAVLALILPGALLLSQSALAGGILLTLGTGASIWLSIWFVTRACLAIPSMADSSLDAFPAFEAGWKIAKDNMAHTRTVVLTLGGLGFAAFLFAIIIVAITSLVFVASGIGSEEAAIGLLALPALVLYAAGLTFAYVAINLTYQALKPAPTEA